MTENYCNHYIITDPQDRIIDGWSDGPLPTRETSGAILHNAQGGYQFRLLFADGLSAENPPLRDDFGVPMYGWDSEYAFERDSSDLIADRPTPVEPTVQPDQLPQAHIDFLQGLYDGAGGGA